MLWCSEQCEYGQDIQRLSKLTTGDTIIVDVPVNRESCWYTSVTLSQDVFYADARGCQKGSYSKELLNLKITTQGQTERSRIKRRLKDYQERWKQEGAKHETLGIAVACVTFQNMCPRCDIRLSLWHTWLQGTHQVMTIFNCMISIVFQKRYTLKLVTF